MPWLKGGEQVVKVEGLRPLTAYCDYSYAVGICPQPTYGVWGYAPPEYFGNFDSLRAFLGHSGSSFWADLVEIFTQALSCKHLEL